MATQRADVIIAGAGIIGASIAWRLAQAGVAVTLLDAGTLGGEASWAGAGMLAPGGEVAGRSRLAELALESLRLYPGFVEELQRESGLAIDYRACGALEFAYTDEERQALEGRLKAQEKLGIRWESREEGMFYPDDALVDPREVTRALQCVCEKRQVRTLEQTRVLALQVGARGVEAATSGGVIEGTAAVLAAGAWSGEIPVSAGEERLPIPATFPVRGHLLGYALAPGSVGPILRRGHTYVMQRASGFTIAGTSSEQVGFNREIDARIVEGIEARARELYPALAKAGQPQAWLGFRPATADYEPAIGRWGETALWLAYGHYRNGILLAPVTAARVAGEITSSLGKG